MNLTNARQNAVAEIAAESWSLPSLAPGRSAEELFASNVFSEVEMERRLPKRVFQKLRRTIRQGKPLDPSIADSVASAMKSWAL